MIFLLHTPETIDSTNKGIAIPMPKSKKFNRLNKKLIVDVETAKSTISGAGLQGKTIAPKNRPKMNALNRGLLFLVGVFGVGIIFEKSKLNIKKMLTIVNIPNAIGEIIPIALVKDSLSNPVKINPTINIEIMTPEAAIDPARIIFFFFSFSDLPSFFSEESWLEM